jgi:hypothetical protein
MSRFMDFSGSWSMKLHLLEHLDIPQPEGANHIPASIGEQLLVGGTRMMKVIEIQIIDDKTHRLTLED